MGSLKLHQGPELAQDLVHEHGDLLLGKLLPFALALALAPCCQRIQASAVQPQGGALGFQLSIHGGLRWEESHDEVELVCELLQIPPQPLRCLCSLVAVGFDPGIRVEVDAPIARRLHDLAAHDLHVVPLQPAQVVQDHPLNRGLGRPDHPDVVGVEEAVPDLQPALGPLATCFAAALALSTALQGRSGQPARGERQGLPIDLDAQRPQIREVPEDLPNPLQPHLRLHRQPPDHAVQHLLGHLARKVVQAPKDVHKFERYPVHALPFAQIHAGEGGELQADVAFPLEVLLHVCPLAIHLKPQGMWRLGRDAPHRTYRAAPHVRRDDFDLLDAKLLPVEPIQVLPVLVVRARHPIVALAVPRLPEGVEHACSGVLRFPCAEGPDQVLQALLRNTEGCRDVDVQLHAAARAGRKPPDGALQASQVAEPHRAALHKVTVREAAQVARHVGLFDEHLAARGDVAVHLPGLVADKDVEEPLLLSAVATHGLDEP
mmetsp:Transcript_114698/g.370641  ORF Transcript_114698/g.370641 Transcript_114698/m.370641 type:complete len:489 (-) Transcript_114698:552-2018(-)